MRSSFALALAFFLALAFAGRAGAQEAGDDVRALLTAAVAEYDGGNYEEAYALFSRVHALQPTARSERALGKAAFELRRYGESVRWLEASLADERSPLTDEMRAEVTALLARARAFVGRFEVHPSAEGATLEVDGAPVTESTLQLDLGEHTLVVRAVGFVDVTRRLTVHGGENESVDVAMTAVPATGGSGPAGPVEDPGGTIRDLGWASLITGAIFAVGGAVATGVWASSVSALNTNIDNGLCAVDPQSESVLPGSPGYCSDQQSRYRISLPFIYIGFVGGGVLMATGLGMVLGAPSASSGDATATRVSCGPFADVGAHCAVTF